MATILLANYTKDLIVIGMWGSGKKIKDRMNINSIQALPR
jgi:hypothetical protein